MRTFHRPLALAFAALGAGAVLTGCTAKEEPNSGPGSTSQGGSASERGKPEGRSDSRDSDASNGDEFGWTSSPLAQAWLDDDPTGSGPQIALRFLQALQDHDDLAADRQLYGWERMILAGGDLDYLRKVMNDVRRNANLDKAGRCRDADWVDSDHVAVDCGSTTVVVRVDDDALATGVRISGWDGHDDGYQASHTHAYTTVEL